MPTPSEAMAIRVVPCHVGRIDRPLTLLYFVPQLETNMPHEFIQIQWDAALAEECRQLVRRAMAEDLNQRGDLTTQALVPADRQGRAGALSCRRFQQAAARAGASTGCKCY